MGLTEPSASATPAPVDLPSAIGPGILVAGRYRVERLIARGGMSAVYLANHVDLKRRVALKLLEPPGGEGEQADADSFVNRFRREAETLAGLSHPHIVAVHDFGMLEDGRAFLAMEYVEGPRLTDLLKEGKVPVQRTIALIGQVCAAVRYAHRKGVVHRDLKPSNLLVAPDDDGGDRVKVVDFGLAKLHDDEQEITRTGLVVGSPHCMSPEQIHGGAVDARSDVYAIGVLLFRCLAGRYPFHGSNSTATMMSHLKDPFPGLPEQPELEPLVRRCLEKDPAARFHDAGEVLEALVAVSPHFIDELPTSSRSTGVRRVPKRPPSETASTVERSGLTLASNRGGGGTPARLVAAGLALMAVGFAGMWWWIRASSPMSTPAAVVPAEPVPVPPVAAPAVEPPPVGEPAPPAAVEPPATTPAPSPAKPKPVAAKPAVRPPTRPAGAPAPTGKPAAEKPAGEKQPGGYLGVPEDW